MLLEPDDLRVRAEAVPGGTVVDGLEVSPHDVADGQRGDDPLFRTDRLHCVAPRRPRLQHVLLPGPGLSEVCRVSRRPPAPASAVLPPPCSGMDAARLASTLMAAQHQHVCSRVHAHITPRTCARNTHHITTHTHDPTCARTHARTHEGWAMSEAFP